MLNAVIKSETVVANLRVDGERIRRLMEENYMSEEVVYKAVKKGRRGKALGVDRVCGEMKTFGVEVVVD